MILKHFTTPNGVAVGFHLLKRIEINAPFDAAQLSVHSYACEAAYLAGSGLAWNTPLQMPLLQVQGDLGSLAERWLTTDPASPFVGGSIVADRSGTLDTARTRAWARIKQARALAETADFACGGVMYQTDKDRIIGAVQLALMAQAAGQPYSIDWTLSDNTYLTLDASGMIAVGAALGAHVAEAFAIGSHLRQQIAAATSFEALDAIVWPVQGDA
ncbi:hypothetical protein VM94_03000 [Janthinobacterium sp. KBS0711]|uniref:DUF4376 domain-containing protein n=1 Tax=Janthinobacterium sp. KBS0711 TaxID=1649647 RepID=UPI000627D78F|nr:DUF4376 domain-containing protein [Janthinobacterium sp. KBS0711]KKO63250.1 hypothetical protein VM94_03000 [Janthinobacterium sp. KBS0711]TSD72767.1 DUF4376 domain-containing protein [Janthinobacterium sp. KBS0711]